MGAFCYGKTQLMTLVRFLTCGIYAFYSSFNVSVGLVVMTSFMCWYAQFLESFVLYTVCLRAVACIHFIYQ